MDANDKKKLDISSKVIHVGSHPDPEYGSIMAPIHMTSTYVQASPGIHKGYEYSRCHNPTRTRLEECLAAIEYGKYALTTCSGMAAVSLLMHAIPSGSTILCGDDVYGGTFRIFSTVFNKIHNFVFLDTTSVPEVKKALKKHKPAMLWLETPTNPMLKISDIAKLSAETKKTNTLCIVDNTFMSPYFQSPLKLGADVVVHSMTKFINGHSDVVAGSIITNKKSLYDELFYQHKCSGPNLSPFDSWLVMRGLKTLAVRMDRHAENAMKIAQFLETHKQVEQVIYPGLASHPQHKLAKTQMSGFGGMITFFLKGGLRKSKKFLESVSLFSLAESLGGVESLIEHPAIMTHASVPKKERDKLGISDNLIRISVGIENVDDLIKDLKKAFKAVPQ